MRELVSGSENSLGLVGIGLMTSALFFCSQCSFAASKNSLAMERAATPLMTLTTVPDPIGLNDLNSEFFIPSK